MELGRTSYSGKVILSGEYAVLEGATALCFPVKNFASVTESVHHVTGAHFSFKNHEEENILEFSVYGSGEIKFRGRTKEQDQNYIKKIFNEISFQNISNRQIEIKFNYPLSLGLGSSAVILAVICDVYKIDPWPVYHKISTGSGADLATIKTGSPIFYTKERNGDGVIIEKRNVCYNFTDNIYFYALGKKVKTEEAIAQYQKRKPLLSDYSFQREASLLSYLLATATTLEVFKDIMKEHETFLSNVLKLPTAKEEFLPWFKGEVKHLGAWKGDMLLLASSESEASIRNQLEENGLNPTRLYRFSSIVSLENCAYTEKGFSLEELHA